MHSRKVSMSDYEVFVVIFFRVDHRFVHLILTYLETPCLTRTPGTAGGGSSASRKANSVGGVGAASLSGACAVGSDLVRGLALPLDRGLPGGGGSDDASGDIRFSFSWSCNADFSSQIKHGLSSSRSQLLCRS